MNIFHKPFHRMTVCMMALLGALMLTACSETEEADTEFDNWQERNEAYFADVYARAASVTDGSWLTLKSYAYEDTVDYGHTAYIVAEVIERGTGKGCPMFTDSVKVSYQGRLIPSASYPEGYLFDSSYKGDFDMATATPVKFVTSALVDGFATALQHMHVGDHWRVYMPQELGYGTSASSSIPAYSTLVFDIVLHDYTRAGKPFE